MFATLSGVVLYCVKIEMRRKQNRKTQYCCERFQESVEEFKVIEKATDKPDETNWYIVDGLHIYYCPLCGEFIKGDGFGDYDKKYPPRR